MHGITGINDTMILQGTIMTLAKEEATSWYVSQYKKRKENPWVWASLWDKFPLSKKEGDWPILNCAAMVTLN